MIAVTRRMKMSMIMVLYTVMLLIDCINGISGISMMMMMMMMMMVMMVMMMMMMMMMMMSQTLQTNEEEIRKITAAKRARKMPRIGMTMTKDSGNDDGDVDGINDDAKEEGDGVEMIVVTGQWLG